MQHALRVLREPVADVEPPLGAEHDVLPGRMTPFGHRRQPVGSAPWEFETLEMDEVPVVGREGAQVTGVGELFGVAQIADGQLGASREKAILLGLGERALYQTDATGLGTATAGGTRGAM